MTCVVTGSYPSNQAIRTQMRGRIARIDSKRLKKKYYKNGELSGVYTAYFDVGEILPEFIIPYKENKVQDTALEYYANQNVYAEMKFVDGKKQGIEKNYFVDGSILSEYTLSCPGTSSVDTASHS